MLQLPAAFANCTPLAHFLTTTPDADFTDHGDGTVTHDKTGLMWKQCVEGRSGASCVSGSSNLYTWTQALVITSNTGGYSDWRLPTKAELQSIVELGCSVGINTTMFPGASSRYWSSTPAGVSASLEAYAWNLDLNQGQYIYTKTTTHYVRLVRGGQLTDSFDRQADYTPDAFSFTAASNVAISTLSESNAITLSGLTTVTGIKVSGGEYQLNGGGYTSVPGVAKNGDTVKVRHTSSASFSTTVSTVLTVGGVTDTFSSTTAAVDTTPDAFSFSDQIGVALSTLTVSNAITVSGLNSTAAISVSGGEYQIGSGSWTTGAGTVSNGSTVTVRHTSSGSSFSTTVNTTLTIGGVADTFSTTTLAVDTVPDAFVFTDQTNVMLSTLTTSNAITVAGITGAAVISITGDEYQIGSGSWVSGAGTVNNGDTVKVRHTSSGSFSTMVNTTLTIGGVADTFSTTTLAVDTTPDAFVFIDQAGVALSTVITSNAITVAGINSATTISVSGGEYQIGSGAWTTSAGTVNNGDTVKVRHTPSGSFSTTMNTTLTIGGVADTFSSTTLAIDTTPDAFVFIDQTGVALSTVITSNAITVAGINSATAISVSGGEYQIGSGAWTTSAGTVNNGDTVKVRHISSGSFSTTVNTTLTIGGVADTFSTTTLVVDTIPDAFSFIDQTNVALSTLTTSNAITVTGITGAAVISITGGEYQIGSGTWTTGAGTVNNGDAVKVRHTSSGSFSMTANTTLTIGGVADTFSTTTLVIDTTPDAFVFIDQTGVAVSTVITSNAITVAGINSATAISVSGGEYQIGSGSWTTSTGTVNNGDTVKVRHTSSGSFSTTVNTTLTIGGVADTFSTTTLAVDTIPDAFSFVDQTNVALSTLTTSNAITVTGITGAAAISITGGEYQIGSGSWTTSTGTVNNGDTVKVRHTSSGSFSTTVNTTLTIGGAADTFSSTTLTIDTTPDAFVFVAQTGVALSTVVTSNTITVASINSATAISVSGGEYQIGSGSWTFSAGTVNNGDTVNVRHTSSGSFSATVNTTLTIGGISYTFSSTSLAIVVVNGACGIVAATSFPPTIGLCASGNLNSAGIARGASSWTWACDGSSGGTGTTANACTAAFGQTATGSGGATSQVSGGTWQFAPSGNGANQMVGFTLTVGHAKWPPTLPPGVSFPHGLFDLLLTGGVAGSSATVTLTYPSAFPAGTRWWKYGKTVADPVNHWYPYSGATIAANTVTLILTDGGIGDDDLLANGAIIDPGGPGVPVGLADIPTLSEWGALLLSGLVMLFAWAAMRQRGFDMA